jgi:hypothetical protein
MNKQNITMLVVALALIGGAALGMQRLKTHQKLGAPGVNTAAIPGSARLNIPLPEKVLDYDSVIVPTDKGVLSGLPSDTSFGQRYYTDGTRNDGIQMNVVLMGTDRTSIHKPQFCLTGSGWNIDGAESSLDTIRIGRPYPYDLPVMKLSTTGGMKKDGETVKVRGIFVYWFVADHDLTASHETRMWNSATHLLRTGELERWAYVFCFARCFPGEEAATYSRLKKFINAAAPEFQLATGPRATTGPVASAMP